MDKRKKIITLFAAMFLMIFTGTFFLNQSSASADNTNKVHFDWQDSSISSDNTITVRYGQYIGNHSYLGVVVDGETDSKGYELKVTCSNPDVLSAKFVYNNVYEPNSYVVNSYNSLELQVKSFGYTKLTVSDGSTTKSLGVYVVTDEISDVTKISQTAYNKIKISWTKATNCTGYLIQRKLDGTDKYVTVKTVTGKSTSSASVTADYNKTYKYRVIPYCKVNGKTVNSQNRGKAKLFTVKSYNTSLISVNKSGSSSLKISWKEKSGAAGYIIYRSTVENSGYKKVKTITSGKTASYTQKVTKGKQYYYKVAVKYPNYTSDKSEIMCGMYPNSGSVQVVSQSNINPETVRGQYVSMWANTEKVAYYKAGGNLYTVVVNGCKLMIYKMDSKNLKAKCVKKVNVGLFSIWGGFYQGDDGNFYVAVGEYNHEQNNKKTVIKVYKYNSNWKKVKTCYIKGNARNMLPGVTIPFYAGNCRMDMIGSKLYLTTSREMYAIDGINHQSNICFEIDTKTMKYTNPQSVYCSHSFNQYATFDNGDLYVINHGDAFPRGVQLSILSDYGTKSEKVTEKTVMKIKGDVGDNYTGLTVGGMEVGKDNVMIVGYSDPQNYKIKGVSGSSFKLHQNAYVIVADKKTGKSSVKWLTTYNPKTTKVNVGELRMVKLTDDRFAVLYCTLSGTKYTFHYVVMNNEGKKVYSKIYSNVRMEGGSQPVLYNGKIVWTQKYYDALGQKTYTKTFAISAIF